MKIRKHLCSSIVIILSLTSCLEAKNNGSFRIIHNNDGSEILGNYWFNQRPLSVDDLNQYVDMVSNSQVTTYMICSGSDFLYYRSKYGRVFGDDRDGALNCGDNVKEYENFKKYYRNHLNLEKEGTDLIRATLTRAKKNGLEAFITYRMNDLHFADTLGNCPVWYSDFWMNHPQYWTNDPSQGWNSAGALDFSHKEVREHKLAIIAEQLEKYEMIDGFDLDFMRFIVNFKTEEYAQNVEVMTQFVRDIRSKVDQISVKRGRKILLSARVPPTVRDCLDKALDVKTWIREGLVDFLSIGVHWRGNPAMPVARFKEDLNGLKIPVYASIDDGGYKARELWSHGMHRGMASHALAQGADGLYLFNFYFGQYANAGKKYTLEPGSLVCRAMIPELLQELGSLNTLKNRNKIYALSDGIREYRVDPGSPLPLNVVGNAVAPFFIGDDVKKHPPLEAILFIRNNENTDFKVFVNDILLVEQHSEYVALYDKARGPKGKECEYAFIVPVNEMIKGYNNIRFEGEGFVVKRIELALKYGEVETHGYF